MYPHERSLVEKYKNRPFAIVGVNSDQDPEKLKRRMEEERITWRSFLDGSTAGPIATRWNVHGWPTIYVLDAKGVIRAKDVRGPQLESWIEKLVAEAEAAAKEAAEEVAEAKAKAKAPPGPEPEKRKACD